MARRKNNLNERELTIVHKVRSRIQNHSMKRFNYYDCDLRNLRPFTIKYYHNEIQAFLNQLEEQDINTKEFSPCNVTEEMIQENVIRYMKTYKGTKIVSISTPLRGLRSFFNFLYKKKHIPKNPMGNIQQLKDKQGLLSIVRYYSRRRLPTNTT